MNPCNPNEKTPQPLPSDDLAVPPTRRNSNALAAQMANSEADLKRFWDSVEIKTPDECWNWRGSIGSNNYGRFHIQGKWHTSHRLARALYQPIPDGLTIDHTCRNKLCQNPNHLDPVTTGVNSRRHTETITHCPKGHEYNESNTRITTTNKRVCRECERMRWRDREAKAKSAVA